MIFVGRGRRRIFFNLCMEFIIIIFEDGMIYLFIKVLFILTFFKEVIFYFLFVLI